MKIAVIGGNGFIGKHVLVELVKKQVDVVAVDISLPQEKGTSPVKWVKMDIFNPPVNVFEHLGCPDSCIHLAWGGLPNYKSLHHFEKELPGQYNFLSTLIRGGLTSLVVSGTCFEYGIKTGELSEDMVPCPTNPYGFAKDVLRRQLEFLRSSIPFAFSWTRLFYLYGAGQAANSLWSQLNSAVLRGDDVFPMSGGSQIRDYLPIEIVAERLVLLANNRADIGIVNICSGRPISVRNLVESWIIKNKWTIKLDLGRYPYPDYEPMEFWGNCSKLNTFLNLK